MYFLRDSLRPLKPVLLPVWKRIATSRLFSATVLHYRDYSEHPILCVGLMKTGTHSVASMIAAPRSDHEPETHSLYHLSRIQASTSQRVQALRARAALLQLDVEANWLFAFHLDVLKKAFPQARFILTVREPGAWVNSQINDEAAYQNEPYVEAWDALFGGFSFPPEEIPLARMGYYTLQGYLSFYSNYYQDAIDTLPPDRTLVVRTSRITQCADSISFAPGPTVCSNRWLTGGPHIKSYCAKRHSIRAASHHP